jgi:tetratricopeptide (TPR) repeat protein
MPPPRKPGKAGSREACKNCKPGKGFLKTVVLLVALCLCPLLCAQRPSQAELAHLSSVLPLIQAKDWRAAEAKLHDALQNFPRSAILSNALGMVYEQEGRQAEAIQAFERAIEWLPSFTAAQLHLGSLYAEGGACDRAKSLLLAAAEHTSDAGALSAAGLGLAQCNDYAAAARILEQAHSLDRSSAATTFNLALARYKTREFDAALAALNDLPAGPEQQRPEVLDLREQLLQAAAIERIRAEQFAAAVSLLEGAHRATPALLSTLGLAQFRLGRYHEAIETYAKAIQLDPHMDAPREGLAFLLYMTGDLEKSRSIVEQGLARPAADFYLWYLRALVLYRMSSALRPEALQSLAQAMRRNPGFAPSYFLRGKIRMGQGDDAAALKDFQTAAHLDPKYPLPYYKMAQIYLRRGRREEAEEARRQFYALGSLREEELLARQAQTLLLKATR